MATMGPYCNLIPGTNNLSVDTFSADKGNMVTTHVEGKSDNFIGKSTVEVPDQVSVVTNFSSEDVGKNMTTEGIKANQGQRNLIDCAAKIAQPAKPKPSKLPTLGR